MNGITKMIGILFLTTTAMMAQQKTDYTYYIARMDQDRRHEMLDSTKVETDVVKRMDSLYMVNPLRNNELCIIVKVKDGTEVFHRTFVRKREEQLKEFKQ